MHRPAPHVGLRSVGSLALAAAAIAAFPAAAAAQGQGSIAGVVRDAETGQPLAGVPVAAMRTYNEFPDATATTDAAGRYRIDGLFGGERYLVLVETGTAGDHLGQFFDRVPCWGRHAFSERVGTRSCGYGDVDPGPIAVRGNRVVRDVDFALDRGGSISGTVTAAATGAPVPGVTVDLWRDFGPGGGVGAVRSVETDAGGGYRFALLPQGEYRFTATVAGFAGEAWPGARCPYGFCDAANGEPVTLGFGEEIGGVDFALAALGAIAGRVTAAGGGEPLAGVTVTAFDPGFFVRTTAVSDAAGGYVLTGLHPGEYILLAREDGDFIDVLYDGVPCAADSGFGCDPGAATRVPVAAAATTAGIDFALPRGGSISGRVTAGGAPLAGLEILVQDAGLRLPAIAVTGPDGSYRAGGLPGGTYFVLTYDAETLGWTDEAFDGVVCHHLSACPARATPIEVTEGLPVDGVDFDLEPPGTIAGRIAAAATGEPIPGIPVRIHGESRSFHAGLTDGNGHYRSPPLPRGSYFVSTGGYFLGSGFADQLHAGVQCPLGVDVTCAAGEGTPVEVRAGETADVDLALDAAADLHCVPSASGACLGGDRFRVSVRWYSRQSSGMGRPLPLGADAAAFWFFAPDNPEVVVRVADACDVLGSLRVLAAGLTDLEAHVTVFDGRTGQAWSYSSYRGTPFPPVFDFDALPCLGPAGVGTTAPAREPVAFDLTALPRSTGACVPSPTRLCLHGGRFAVEADWTPPGGAPGPASAVPLGERSGWFWFVRPGAPALVVKMLDGCGVEGTRGWWLFAAGLTDREVTLRVTDLVAGGSREVDNPAGRRFEPVQDQRAFPCP